MTYKWKLKPLAKDVGEDKVNSRLHKLVTGYKTKGDLWWLKMFSISLGVF